jgi:hypothetical protein
MKNVKASQQQNPEFTADENKKQVFRKCRFSKQRCEFQIKKFMMNRIMRPLKQFLIELDTMPFKEDSYILVLKENVKKVFKGSYPALKIDYQKLILSKGKLPNAPGMSVCSPKSGKLTLHWTDNSGICRALASDLLFIAVFNRSSQRWLFNVDAAPRSARYYSLDVKAFQGKLVQVYVGFISEDSRQVSSSLYLGEVRVL